MANFQCFSCNRVFLLIGANAEKCPSCGGTNGEVISNERVREGREAGVYYDIDLKTGGRAKRRR